MCKAIAAPNRVLNETNAAGTSYMFKKSTQQVVELDIVVTTSIYKNTSIVGTSTYVHNFSKAKSSNQCII